MKITSFYYLAYPDCSPPDPMMASSEIYVEVAVQEGSLDSFDFTYALTISTVGFLKQYLETHPYYVSRSLIVVEHFDDKVIKETLEALLPSIQDFAIRK